ncbi:MAG TPA: tetratricopeptide repeat protein [Chthoniobacteraceae bacterium]|jgi:tetratricopeptide (TPR) repeat protein|nr:tetratricopeptide repeat protein [Chthoniobacteraceae bacterium]
MPPLFRSRLFLGAFVVLAVIVCYLPALRAGFVWDDDLLVTENPLVQNTDSLPTIWTKAATSDYTPLTTTAFWLQWRLWEDDATGYHLVNILLFALSALLLWRVLEMLAIPGAWLCALLFAMHPVNVASVAWVAELKNALSLPFYLAAILGYLRFLETRKAGDYALTIGAAACAMLSKGSTVILPVALLLCAWWKRRRITWADIVALLPLFLLSGIAALVTIHFQARVMDAYVAPAPVAARIARAGEAIWFYLGKDLWPVRLCAIYPKWKVGGYVPLALAGALLVALWLARSRIGRGPFFAWAYFLIALAPALGILDMTFIEQAYVADWWQQLALPGIVAGIGAGLAKFWQRQPVAAGGGIAVIATLLAVQTFSEARGYQSMEIFCRRTLALNPDAWTAHNNLGNTLNLQGRLEAAAAEYLAALRLKPTDASTHSNLGTVYARLQRFDEAIAQYRAAIALVPDNAKYWFNLGNALRLEKRNSEAIDAFSHAIDENARWSTPRYEMGSILLGQGRAREAGEQAEVIVHVDPASISGHYLMARAAAAVGRFDMAATEAQAALEIARQAGDSKAIQQMQQALDAVKARRQPAAPEP